MKQISIETQEKYIAQTYELDKELSELMKELALGDVSPERLEQIEKRLRSLYTAQASNAVILADFLKANIG